VVGCQGDGSIVIRGRVPRPTDQQTASEEWTMLCEVN